MNFTQAIQDSAANVFTKNLAGCLHLIPIFLSIWHVGASPHAIIAFRDKGILNIFTMERWYPNRQEWYTILNVEKIMNQRYTK